MPRKKKTSKNVINFPTTQNNAPVPTKEIEQKVEKGKSKVLEIIDKNRKQGLEKLERCIGDYDCRPMITGEDKKEFNEGMLRDVEAGIRAAFVTLEALNNLVEMIRHDLVGMIQNIEGLSVANWQSSAHLQTLLALLKEKEVVDETELKATWEKVVASQIKKSQADMKAAEAAVDAAEPIEPESSD